MNERPLNLSYFRDYAKSIGCKDVDSMGDLAVWNYILRYQGKEEIDVS